MKWLIENRKVVSGRPRRRAGFSLIELLLGVSIFSIVAVTIYSTFSGGILLSRRAQKNDKVYREIRWAFDRMSRDLENAVFYDFSGSYEDRLAFVGEEDKIILLLAGEDGLKAVKYYLSDRNPGLVKTTIIGETFTKNVDQVLRLEQRREIKFLVREEMPFEDYLSDKADRAKQEIYSSSIADGGLKFYYGFASGGNTSETVWKTSWEKNYIPSGVRIEIDFQTFNKANDVIHITRDVLIPAGIVGDESS